MLTGPIDPAGFRCTVVLTGAGISVASGLRPYRGAGGLWTEHPDQEHLVTADALARDPAAVWRVLGSMRTEVNAARPNDAHRALALLESRALSSGSRFVVITQNVDGLHQRAGSRNVVEIHGTLSRSRCTDCDRAPFEDSASHQSQVPRCAHCGGVLRPDVVLFGEYPNVDDEHRAKLALRDCDLFMAIGTSGTVAPASSYVRWAEVNGARTIFVNVEPMAPPNPAFAEVLIGRAEDVLRDLAAPWR